VPLSPRATARLAGVFELLEGATSVVAQMVLLDSFVAREPAITAANILANEPAFRLGVALSLVTVVLHLAWGYLLYELLKIVSRPVARFGVLLLVVSSTLQAITALLAMGALVTLLAGDGLGVPPEQRAALAQVFMRLSAQSNNFFLAIFGFWLISIGYLVFRSTLIPRLIGVALVLEGIGWVTYAWPPLAVALLPVIAVFGVFGELALTAWLLIRGMDSQRWRALAATEAAKGQQT